MGNVGIENVGLTGQADFTIRLLRKQSPIVFVFSADKIFTTLCVPFPNIISHFKILATP